MQPTKLYKNFSMCTSRKNQMIFTEEDYKFGPLFKSCTDSSVGCPPDLGLGRKVCSEKSAGYIDVVRQTTDLMKPWIDEYVSEVDILLRSSSTEQNDWHNYLCLQTYLMQEFVPNGTEHPLYKAATQATLANFKAGIDLYKQKLDWALRARIRAK